MFKHPACQYCCSNACALHRLGEQHSCCLMDSHLVISPCCDIALIGCCIDTHAFAEADIDSEAQMQLLFAELKRIEGQQQQLQTAVTQNRVLVVHPPKGFHADSVEAEYAEEKEVKPDPDRFIPSGDSQVLRIKPSGTTGSLADMMNQESIVSTVDDIIDVNSKGIWQSSLRALMTRVATVQACVACYLFLPLVCNTHCVCMRVAMVKQEKANLCSHS